MMSCTVLTIADGKLFALVHPYELDGRAASHPLDLRGFSTMNCYLLTEDDGALLVSTGYSVHRDDLLAQLEELVGDRTLALAVFRVEFTSLCNARPIADRFRVEHVHQQLSDVPSDLLNFRPEFDLGADDGLRNARRVAPRPGAVAAVGSDGRRELQFLQPKLRLLPSVWAYDRETRTLFTGDMFAWGWRETSDGPWLVDDEDDDATMPERLQHFLLQNRYWWLAGARTLPLRRWLAEIFERYDVDVIAPDHGCLLRGGAVARHVQLLDDFLAAAPSLEPIGLEVNRWRIASHR
jgi:hypothetical protein